MTQKIITRAEAMALGLKRYFTGKACKWGHFSPRRLSSVCIGCDLRHRQHRPSRQKIRELECCWCSKIFRTGAPLSGRKYCSKLCSHKARMERQKVSWRRARGINDARTCVVCGVQFRGHATKKVCSLDCRREHSRAIVAAYRKSNPDRTRESVRRAAAKRYLADPELCREKRRAFYLKHRERFLSEASDKAVLVKAALLAISILETEGVLV